TLRHTSSRRAAADGARPPLERPPWTVASLTTDGVRRLSWLTSGVHRHRVSSHIAMREPIAIRDEVGADAAEPREAGQYVISSALRTLQVLRAFAEPPHRLGLADVTSRLGLEKIGRAACRESV